MMRMTGKRTDSGEAIDVVDGWRRAGLVQVNTGAGTKERGDASCPC